MKRTIIAALAAGLWMALALSPAQGEILADLVQSTCREVLEGLQGMNSRKESAFRRWLYTAALRKIQNRRRFWTAEKRDARRVVSPTGDSEGGGETGLLECYQSFTTPSQHAMASEEVASAQRQGAP